MVVIVREQGTGNGERGTEERFWATLLFVTYVGFFPFTYLLQSLKFCKIFYFFCRGG
jgi:hypothetical protein